MAIDVIKYAVQLVEMACQYQFIIPLTAGRKAVYVFP
ncbi:hypothetical protein Terro_2333 [Terriglobus roseus DSM 18391]|uniref:Uncharacterized protein n=1 Tax=Terriglobus roseus (strain DSM 18391 / NRRL B-41598 / KBS 63) TaxID=926566 RepID=I3ZG85_TERRK|nr:hypothetical protein Terro_1967 [Terriglobus roseus DSM 18391]AFL88594.1 hypothetical protein Terro_2333 [Terriglobus roseus DSM 18391]